MILYHFHTSGTSRWAINISMKVNMREQIECLYDHGNDHEEGKKMILLETGELLEMCFNGQEKIRLTFKRGL